LGRNGAGKTTLLNCLIDLVEPDSGQFLLNGETLTGERQPLKDVLGILSDAVPPVPEFTGYDYLKFVSLIYRIDDATFKKRTKELISFFFDEEKILNKRISQYSTGMTKKICLCATILHTPDLLILDEPFAGLDPVAAQQLIAFLEAYRNSNRIILIASHDLSYLQKIANRILVLDDTQIKYDGSLDGFTSQGTKVIDEALFELLAPKTKEISFDWI
jgi:ABC-type multidrug transport system ATPase subunit